MSRLSIRDTHCRGMEGALNVVGIVRSDHATAATGSPELGGAAGAAGGSCPPGGGGGPWE